jgi:hypothetical protein
MRILYTDLISNYETVQIGTKYYWKLSNTIYSAYIDTSDTLYVMMVLEDIKAL